MNATTRTEAPIEIEGDGVELRVQPLGGGMSAGFVRLPKGADLRPAVVGLPHDLCPCPHWGYVLSGRVRMHTTNGPQEYVAGDAFYWAPGHAPEALEDSEYVDFSPTDEFNHVLAHIKGSGKPPPWETRHMTTQATDSELKARHRKMWASGDYPEMVTTFLLPIGERLVEAAGISDGDKVLDVAAGTGNASLVAAARGAHVTASDLTPELLDAGRARAADAGLELEWAVADAEALPFEDGAFDVVMSAIGVMFAPFHPVAADELVRVCKPGGTIALLSWTPEGMIGSLFRAMKEFAPPPPAGAQSPPLWGSEEHLTGLMGGRVEFTTLVREDLEITAFGEARGYGEHFKAFYGPTIAARANAERNNRAGEFDAAVDAFCDEWDRGQPGAARFEQEYLVAVGTRV